MKKLLILAVALFATSAAAQEHNWYAGGQIGQSNAKSACDAFSAAGISCDNKDTAFKAFGGYQFNKYLAAEIGYANLGKSQASGPGGTASVKASAFDAVAVGTFPVMERLGIYGKAGFYRASTDANVNTVTLRADQSETNSDLTYGLGVRFDFTPRLFGRLEWQRYQNVGGGSIGESDVDVISAGVAFRF